ncbi:MAG TPA: type III-B CRISPR module RAMP protein Cmr6 [Thermotogae bacterium]|nr:type III-B CRISPR module RAMP protein Cmr6 [Thermotogota bacterium]
MKGFLKNIPKKSNNLGLFWEKYSYIKYHENFLKSNDEKKKGDLAYKLLADMKIDENVLKLLKKRREQVVKNSNVLFDDVVELKSRLLVGSGNPAPTEVGMTFSRNYGVPVIPASAIKGCFSHYLKEILEEDGEKLIDKETFRYLFGEDLNKNSEENIRGSLIFLDAIPITLEFGLDIVNNHFQPYYMQKEHPPNDWYNPVPVTFLVVEKGKFRFTILIDEERNEGLNNETKEKLRNAFRDMLETYGIGAKTNYGYGRFKKNSQ